MLGLQKDYEELNLVPGASADEIRKAYRTRVLQCHPDKTATRGDGDGGAAFHRATEAYRRLSNANQFMQFSTARTLDANAAQAILSETMRTLFIWLAFAFKNAASHGPCREDAPVTAASNVIDVPCPVTLEDLMCKRIKKITLRVQRGGKLVSQTLYVSTLNYKSTYTFEGVGDERDDGQRGDVRVHLRILPDASPFDYHIDDLLSRYDIGMTLHVSLLDYYAGRTFEIPYLDGTVMQVPYEPGSNVFVTKGAGLPYVTEDGREVRGDLMVHFQMVLPSASKVFQEPGFMQRLQKICALETGDVEKTGEE